MCCLAPRHHHLNVGYHLSTYMYCHNMQPLILAYILHNNQRLEVVKRLRGRRRGICPHAPFNLITYMYPLYSNPCTCTHTHMNVLTQPTLTHPHLLPHSLIPTPTHPTLTHSHSHLPTHPTLTHSHSHLPTHPHTHSFPLPPTHPPTHPPIPTSNHPHTHTLHLFQNGNWEHLQELVSLLRFLPSHNLRGFRTNQLPCCKR